MGISEESALFLRAIGLAVKRGFDWRTIKPEDRGDWAKRVLEWETREISMSREYNLIDAYDELRRIGPLFSEAVHELDRLFKRLPQRLVDRIQEAVPETETDLELIGAKLSALAQAMADEVDALPEVLQDALVEQIEARRRRERAPRPARERAA